MFVGHYAPGFAIKAVSPKAPMWALLAAVQGIDIVWAVLVPAGIERARIAPNEALPGMPLVLDFMPYTHSLLGSIVISLALALLVGALVRDGDWKMVMWITVAGVSHWFLDLLVHQPDLTLYGAPPKLGLSLWAYKWPELALEIVIVLLGLGIYRRATEAPSAAGRVALRTVGALLVVVALVEKTMPPPPSIEQATLSALALYVVFILCGLWLDRTRTAMAA